MTLPLILAVWLIKWFVVFLHHCLAWIFYLLGSVLLATAILSYLMQQSQANIYYCILCDVTCSFFSFMQQ